MGKTVIGIDIAYGALKITALEHKGNGFRLVGLSYGIIPKDSWTDSELKNQDEIIPVLKKCLEEAKPHRINSNLAMIALPEAAIFSTVFNIPNLKQKELEDALPFEIASKLSVNLEDYVIDYETSSSACQPVVAETEEPKQDIKEKDSKATKKEVEAVPDHVTAGEHYAVFAVATKKALVNSLTEFCQKAGLKLVGVDIKSDCIVRSLISGRDEEMRMVVDLGASATGITVAEGQSTRLISAIPVGTQSYSPKSPNALELFNKESGPIFDEVIHVTKFYQNRVCPGKKITQLVLAGGGSDIPGIAAVFEKETGLPAVIGEAFHQVDTHKFPIPREFGHKFADSVGLAMRKIS